MASTMQPAPDAVENPGESVLEHLLLIRLERAAARLADPRVQALPAWYGLAERAAAASFRDCVAVGLRREASLILGDIGPVPAGRE
jgi:hypothetical protein